MASPGTHDINYTGIAAMSTRRANYGICALQGAHDAIHNPLKAHQCDNPPQYAIRSAQRAKLLQTVGPYTVRTQEWLLHWSPKLLR
eukprot:13845253-Alexandrium_andersonii.AAC.1